MPSDLRVLGASDAKDPMLPALCRCWLLARRARAHANTRETYAPPLHVPHVVRAHVGALDGVDAARVRAARAAVDARELASQEASETAPAAQTFAHSATTCGTADTLRAAVMRPRRNVSADTSRRSTASSFRAAALEKTPARSAAHTSDERIDLVRDSRRPSGCSRQQRGMGERRSLARRSALMLFVAPLFVCRCDACSAVPCMPRDGTTSRMSIHREVACKNQERESCEPNLGRVF